MNLNKGKTDEDESTETTPTDEESISGLEDVEEDSDEESPEPEQTLPVGTTDVDVATLSTAHLKGEVGPVILAGYWVRLGVSDDIDPRFHGVLASVIESPWKAAPIGVPDQIVDGYTLEKNKDFIVQTRDTANARLTVKVTDILSYAQNRVDLAR